MTKKLVFFREKETNKQSKNYKTVFRNNENNNNRN